MGCLREMHVPGVLEELEGVCGKASIVGGDLQKWDLSTLTHLLLFNTVWGGWFISTHAQSCLNELRTVRNTAICHLQSVEFIGSDDVDTIKQLLMQLSHLCADEATVSDIIQKVHESMIQKIVDSRILVSLKQKFKSETAKLEHMKHFACDVPSFATSELKFRSASAEGLLDWLPSQVQVRPVEFEVESLC